MQKNHTIIYGSSDDLVEINGQVDAEYENYTLAKRGIPFNVQTKQKEK
jgi:hypothetical protein